MEGAKELIIEASIKNLNEVLAFVCEELERAGVSEGLLARLSVVVEEVFVNIANYAYAPKVGNALIRVSVGKEIELAFEDMGIPFNPLLKNDPDIGADIEERGIGGLGIVIVKKTMDIVEYRYEDNKNKLLLKKRI